MFHRLLKYYNEINSPIMNAARHFSTAALATHKVKKGEAAYLPNDKVIIATEEGFITTIFIHANK